ncbi:Uncharacterized protein dnm_091510 [Desulfonema magnum]|uniref:Uncharacterized protein n=1 Tax=Desulfonema magnum TaxID=45655 RepID=A0A975GTG5_9BACT|nr:Uncharacterized protein dnm_091510 [Desulfonema magnum]
MSLRRSSDKIVTRRRKKMIEKNFEEAFTPEWVSNNITDQANELVVLRKIIP